MLRWIGLGIAAPFLLVALLSALVTALLDFTWFRVHASFTGDPHPKGLWEF
jgi:cytochrome c biogenesis protein CcdA